MQGGSRGNSGVHTQEYDEQPSLAHRGHTAHCSYSAGGGGEQRGRGMVILAHSGIMLKGRMGGRQIGEIGGGRARRREAQARGERRLSCSGVLGPRWKSPQGVGSFTQLFDVLQHKPKLGHSSPTILHEAAGRTLIHSVDKIIGKGF